MGMKNVLIVSHCMEIGGAERALLGLLNAFDFSRYNVELFLLRHTGELMEYIPKEVKLLPENKNYPRANKKYQAESFNYFLENPEPLHFGISNLDSFAWYSYCKGTWKALRNFVLPSRQLMP